MRVVVTVRNPLSASHIDCQLFHTYVPHPNCGDFKYLQNDEFWRKKINGLLNLIWGSRLYLSTPVAQSPAHRYKQLKVGVSDGGGRTRRSSTLGSLRHSCPQNQVTSESPFDAAGFWRADGRRGEPRRPPPRPAAAPSPNSASPPSPRPPAASPSVSRTASSATAAESSVGSLCCSSCRKESR